MSATALPSVPNHCGNTSAETIGQLVDSLIEQISELRVPERRREPRMPLAMPIHCRPWDALRGQYDEEFVAVSRHISKGGIALLHTSNITSAFLHLEMSRGCSSGFEVVLEVLRTRRVGPLWEIAGRFLFV